MQLPWTYGRPTGEPGVFAIGSGDWITTWSPGVIHPDARQWLEWSSRTGPSPRLAPRRPDMWFYTLFTRDLHD